MEVKLMDIIDKCVANGEFDSQNQKFGDKTWNDFIAAAKNKKVILRGVAGLLKFLWIRCSGKIEIAAALDNDEQKIGHELNEFFEEYNLDKEKSIIITSADHLKYFDPNEVVILISSRKSYDAIAAELERQGFYNYFSALHLEYYFREYMKKNNLPFKVEDDIKHDYALECAKNFPIQNNKIIIYNMDQYLDHGKYITEQLLNLSKNLKKKLDIIWLGEGLSKIIPKGVRALSRKKWKNFIYEMETMHILVDNSFVTPRYLVKRNEQVYIQVKHWGSITLKSFYLEDLENQIKNNINFFQNEQLKSSKELYLYNSRCTNFIVTGSEFDEESCRRGFDFNGPFLRFGSPRSDVLFQSQSCKEKICQYFNLDKKVHILLYVPTYRRYAFDSKLDFDRLLKSLKTRWNGDWKIFLRLHIFAKKDYKGNEGIPSKMDWPEYIIDVSDYRYGQELVAASDIVISDYSSIMFEPAYVLKPVFLYIPDKDEYFANDRYLLIDYDSLPFPISTTNEQLSEQIATFDEEKYRQEVKAFLDRYGVHEDGHASERTAKFILRLLEN